jgi:hypothetical protein
MSLVRIPLVLSFLVSSYSFAGVTSYQCSFLEEQKLNDSGTLEIVKNSSVTKQIFSVNRTNGGAITPDSAMWPYKDSEVQLISLGNSESAFQVIYTAPAKKFGVHTTFFRIQEFAKGQNKPFIAITGNIIQTGVCK